MTATGVCVRCRRAVLTTSLVLLFLAVAFGCGPQEGRLESGVSGHAPQVARTSLPPPSPRCDPFVDAVRGNFVRWSRDGSSIVFYWVDGLYHVWADGSEVRLIDTEPTVGWHAFDVAPDGRQFAYSGCRFEKSRGDSEWSYLYGERAYDLVRANIDGGWSKRLAYGYDSGIFPSWSPDGERLALLSGANLIVMAADGSTQQAIELRRERYYAAPRWSPDSRRLAVTAATSDPRVGRVARSPVVYTVGADGSDPRRLVSGVVSAPTWSPDGQWLAYARVGGGEVILAAIRTDGTDERQLATIAQGDWTARNVWIRTLSWSPDGRHLAYSCGQHLCVVATDGRPTGRTPALPGGSMGAWSPDGRRIVVTGFGMRDVVLYTMAPDGGQLCPVVRVNTDYVAPNRNAFERLWRTIFGGDKDHPLIPVRDCGSESSQQLVTVSSRITERPVDLASCASGTAVPEPANNPGLLADCQTLLAVRDVLDRDDRLNWSANRPLAAWDGVTVGGTPPRVLELDLAERWLRGALPIDLRQLTKLQTLNLSSNGLAGMIPRTFAELTQLRTLNLRRNLLRGPIPSELGRLTQLRVLDLSYTQLTGPIPSELGRLTQLRVLDLSVAKLAGSTIPPELAKLTKLESVKLLGNGLTGQIPSGLGQIPTLRVLRLEGNDLTGCRPPGLQRSPRVDIDLQTLRLPICMDRDRA